jgi:hypothetical protein
MISVRDLRVPAIVGSQHAVPDRTSKDPMSDPHDRLRRGVDEFTRDDDDLKGHQRNSGLAILVLAGLVVALLVAIVMGGFPGM